MCVCAVCCVLCAVCRVPCAVCRVCVCVCARARACVRACVCVLCVFVDDDADAKLILTSPPPNNGKRPPGRPRITWLNTVQRDLRAYNLTLNEAVDLAQNHPLRRLLSMYGTTHS